MTAPSQAPSFGEAPPGADVPLLVVAETTSLRAAGHARFRWSSTAAQGPATPTKGGEAEDHALTISPTARLVLHKTALIAP